MDFITKDSGSRQSFDSGMHRDTQDDKPRFDLMYLANVPYDEQPLTRFAQLLRRGSEKYSARNWELAAGTEELERFKASALRHLTQYLCGDTEEDHQAAVIFNIFGTMLVEYKMRNGESKDA